VDFVEVAGAEGLFVAIVPDFASIEEGSSVQGAFQVADKVS
jgi:hypothetical protein